MQIFKRMQFKSSLTFARKNHGETLLALVLPAKGDFKGLKISVKYSRLDVTLPYLTQKGYLVFSTMESSSSPLAELGFVCLF